MDYGFVVGRPYLGVSTQDVSLSGYGFFTSAYTYPCIVSVEDGSAAQQAGLKKDDVIMAVNGETVSSSDGLYIAVSKFKVGDTVTLTILRSNFANRCFRNSRPAQHGKNRRIMQSLIMLEQPKRTAAH